MPEIKTLEDIYAWLEGCEPYEATAVASRAALRVLPMLPPAVDGWESLHSDLLLPVFRAVSIPWFAFSWETPDTELSEAAKVAFRTVPEAKIRINHGWAGSEEVSPVIPRPSAARELFGFMGDTSRITDLSYPMTANVTDPARAAMIRVIVTTGAAFTAFTVTDNTEIKSKFREAFLTTGTDINDNHLRDLVKATTDDITALEGGTPFAELSAMPLWPDGKPEKLTALWGNLKSRLPEDEHWDVWTEWYEARLRGDSANSELEKARILIPDGDWKQGPAHVNAIIKRLVADHRTRSLAEADFRYDPDRHAMEMVPFMGDAAPLEDEAVRKHLFDELEDLGVACNELASDLEDENRQVPLGFCRDLTRYGRETAHGPDSVRPGILRRLGEALIRGAADEDLRHGMGNYLCPKLDEIIARHLSLQAKFHAGMLARMKPLSEARLTVSPDEAEKKIDEAMKVIDSDEWRNLLPSVPDELPEMVEIQRGHLREMASRIDLKVEGEARVRATRAVEEGYVRLAATIGRLGVQTIKAIGEDKVIGGVSRLASILSFIIALVMFIG